jgi:hypothetical protein
VVLIPLCRHIAAIALLAILVALLTALIVIETVSYGDSRARIRHELAREATPD